MLSNRKLTKNITVVLLCEKFVVNINQFKIKFFITFVDCYHDRNTEINS